MLASLHPHDYSAALSGHAGEDSESGSFPLPKGGRYGDHQGKTRQEERTALSREEVGAVRWRGGGRRLVESIPDGRRSPLRALHYLRSPPFPRSQVGSP